MMDVTLESVWWRAQDSGAEERRGPAPAREAVETYGAGGCPTCHDAELRAAIALLREFTARSQ